ncbi:MAG: hypothetical protein KDD83_29360, partial [Caldilineaceae bacterium]|nr:hypothetical protein [Caldilineaceae bacterium]
MSRAAKQVAAARKALQSDGPDYALMLAQEAAAAHPGDGPANLLCAQLLLDTGDALGAMET